MVRNGVSYCCRLACRQLTIIKACCELSPGDNFSNSSDHSALAHYSVGNSVLPAILNAWIFKWFYGVMNSVEPNIRINGSQSTLLMSKLIRMNRIRRRWSYFRKIVESVNMLAFFIRLEQLWDATWFWMYLFGRKKDSQI